VKPLIRVLSTALGIALVSGLGLATAPDATAASDAAKKSFVASLVSPAQSAQREYGVPASVTIAQAAVNTDWGSSKLADSADNFFNIRCSATMTAAEFAKLAEAQVGKKYVLGAEAALTNSNPKAFDCSELVQWLFGRSGNPITDLAASQYNATSAVSTSSPKPGDLVFLRNNPARSNGIGHVAVVTKKLSNGDWEVIEARGHLYGVVKTTLSYWKKRSYFAGMRRYSKLTFAGQDGVIKTNAMSTYQSGCVSITSGGSTVKYRSYSSATNSVLDHAEYVANESSYAAARKAMGSVSSYVDAISGLEGGSDPAGYAKQLRQVIDAYDLTQYDVAPLSIVLLSKATGAKVTALQNLLTAAGKTVKVTGTFDSATATAVKAFQKAKGLTVDGEAGPDTLTALMATTGKGDDGARGAALNALLVQAGYPTDAGSTIGATTLGSLKDFQAATGLEATGSANAKTWSRLFMLLETAPAPVLSGTTTVGKVLTAATGAWGPGKVDVAYQWYRGATAIPGATATTYTLQPEDAGQAVKVVTTGSRASYTSVSRVSAATAAVTPATLTKTPKPVVTGTAAAGKTLTASGGTWAPGPVSIAFQWYRSGKPIAGATAQTYTLTAADYKAKMSVRAVGSRLGYYSVSTFSKATSAVQKGKLTAVGKPSIAGTAAVGATLTANPGTWGPGQIALSYQWYRGSTAIKGATSNTYKVATADVGKVLSVKVTSKTSAFASRSATSKATAKVSRLAWAAPPKLTLSGTAKVGKVLTGKVGTWKPSAKLSYRWYRDSKAIKGATKASHKIVTADRKHTVYLVVTATRSGYQTVSQKVGVRVG
jgi:cell wall-associated NlpC family hydrolase/peptidoglycan hydrolase-like protein with peptidoglycan-binding domain